MFTPTTRLAGGLSVGCFWWWGKRRWWGDSPVFRNWKQEAAAEAVLHISSWKDGSRLLERDSDARSSLQWGLFLRDFRVKDLVVGWNFLFFLGLEYFCTYTMDTTYECKNDQLSRKTHLIKSNVKYSEISLVFSDSCNTEFNCSLLKKFSALIQANHEKKTRALGSCFSGNLVVIFPRHPKKVTLMMMVVVSYTLPSCLPACLLLLSARSQERICVPCHWTKAMVANWYQYCC